jgi:hypothetical protein
MTRLIILILLSGSVASAQALRGTIVVYFYNNAKVVFAADSRSSVWQATVVRSHLDDECKILVFRKNILAAFGGFVGVSDPFGLPDHAAQVIAREQAAKLGNNDPNPAKTLGIAWSRSMLDYITRTSAKDPTIKRKASDDFYSWALFAAANSNGRLVLVRSRVFWNAATQIFDWGGSELNPPDQYSVNGTKKSYPTFVRLRKQSLPEDYHPEWKDREAAKAVYLAEQTRDQANDERLGGKIDSVELRRGASKAEWITRKKGCPAN